jgi:hypothetical protein
MDVRVEEDMCQVKNENAQYSAGTKIAMWVVDFFYLMILADFS